MAGLENQESTKEVPKMYHPYQYEEYAKEYQRERWKEAETLRISIPKRSEWISWRSLKKRFETYIVSLLNTLSVYFKRLSKASGVQ